MTSKFVRILLDFVFTVSVAALAQNNASASPASSSPAAASPATPSASASP